MLAPQTQVTSLVCTAMYPVLARVKEQRERLTRAYLRIVHVIACITFPLLCGLFAVAYPFIDILLGQKWRGAAPILQILCVAALIQSITATTGLIYQTQGRTDWAFRWGGTAAALTLVAFGIGIFWGVEGVAAAYSVRTVLLLPVNYEIAGRLIGLRFSDVVRAVRAPLAASIAMAVFVWLLGMVLPHAWSPVVRLLTQVGAGALLYLPLAMVALDGGNELRELLRDRRVAAVAHEVTA
jgi:PST family polysaccharide transporter